MKKILIIQTAFIGDVILATPVITALREKFPDALIYMLVRKGNEALISNHPDLQHVLIWDKSRRKLQNLFSLLLKIRGEKFDAVYNLHRFASSGLLTCLSGATEKTGFSKNPFSFCFTRKVPHHIGDGTHEIQRNLSLISDSPEIRRPALFPADSDIAAVEEYRGDAYVCIAPASVWFTKQYHKQGWIDLCNQTDEEKRIYLIGSPSDSALCQAIAQESSHQNIINLAGKLTLVQSAVLMKHAQMNYVNDSAPLHLASAMNAPVVAVFCSTIPEFGFGPVSENARIVQAEEPLACRPCGLHGYRACPEKHFKCARNISTDQFFEDDERRN